MIAMFNPAPFVHDTSWCRRCPQMIRLVDRFNPHTGLNERVWIHTNGDLRCSLDPMAGTAEP